MSIPRFDRGYRHLRRYRQIVSVMATYGFDHLLDRMGLTPYLQRGRRLLLRQQADVEHLSLARRLRFAMEELGPTFVKLGQVLSMRPFLIPGEIVVELARLQDEVAPFSYEEAKRVFESEIGPIEGHLRTFDERPLASASLAQVHRGETIDGQEVVVKIQRPGLKKALENDLEILRELAGLLERHVPESRQYDPTGMVQELEMTTRRELNFSYEGKNVDRFAQNFREVDTVKVPRVFWAQSSSKVLTLERIHGVKISDLEEIERRGLDRKTIARNGGKVVLKQIFEDGFFHADPHPGNLFVLEGNVIAPVDYGMMGHLDQTTMEDLSEAAIAIYHHDHQQLVNLLTRMGFLEREQEIDSRAFQRELGDFLDRYYGLPLEHLDLREITDEIFRLVHRFQIHLPSHLMLLGKAITTYEEVGRLLDPEYNFMAEAEPFLDRLARRQFTFRKFRGEAIRNWQSIIRLFRHLPRDLEVIAERVRSGRWELDLRHRELERTIIELSRASNRLAFSLIIASLIVGSSFVIQLDRGLKFLGYPILGILGFVLAAFLGLWLVIAILRSGRL